MPYEAMTDLLLLRYESRKVRNLEETIEDWQLLHDNLPEEPDIHLIEYKHATRSEQRAVETEGAEV